MAWGAHFFVAVVYAALAASFIASTATLILEFKDQDWLSMALAHSHLFVFFPTFGIVVLAAFYWPSVIFTHLYWSKDTGVRLGKLRFIVGFAAVIAASWWVAQQIGGSDLRGIWEVQPAALAQDKGVPTPCAAADGASSICQRVPILTALEQVRAFGRKRVGLAEFTRNCVPDPLIERPPEYGEKRYCFAAGTHLDTQQCCDVQKRFAADVRALQADPQVRSRSAELDQYFLPLKVFFIAVMVLIAALLAFWRKRIDVLYPEYVPAIERGIIIGGLSMLTWPLMDYAYLQTSMALFGRMHGGLHFRWSLIIVPWAILLPFFFLRRLDKNREMIAQGASVIASAVAILRYPQINDWAVRLLGAGAEPWTFGLFAGLSLIAFIWLFWRTDKPPPNGRMPSHPSPLT
jgi:hypothetical protein